MHKNAQNATNSQHEHHVAYEAFNIYRAEAALWLALIWSCKDSDKTSKLITKKWVPRVIAQSLQREVAKDYHLQGCSKHNF